MKTPKLCKDCKWCRPFEYPGLQDWRWPVAECTCPRNLASPAPSLVDGESSSQEYRWPACCQHRSDGWLDRMLMRTCGRAGRWWEAKP